SARHIALPRTRRRACRRRLARSRQPQIRRPQPRRTRCRPKAACASLPSKPAGDQTRSRPPSRTRSAGSSPTQRCDVRRHARVWDYSGPPPPHNQGSDPGPPPRQVSNGSRHSNGKNPCVHARLGTWPSHPHGACCLHPLINPDGGEQTLHVGPVLYTKVFAFERPSLLTIPDDLTQPTPSPATPP